MKKVLLLTLVLFGFLAPGQDAGQIQAGSGVSPPASAGQSSPSTTPPASQCVQDSNANGVGDVADIEATAAETDCHVYLPLVAAQWRQPWPTPAPPPILVSIVMHNEEPPGYPDFVNDEPAFWQHRNALGQFADMLHANGVMFNYQSDWNFLQAVAKYDTGTPETNGKNVVRYIKEDLGFEVDPHAHETLFNYADVAYLIEALGVDPSHTVGGMIVHPPEDSILEQFWQPITGRRYPTYTWQAEILWGGGTRLHVNEESLWTSGVWKPKDKYHFLEHAAAAPLPNVGNYGGKWENLDRLLQLQQTGELEDKIHTSTISVRQDSLLTPGFIQQFEQRIQARDAAGDIQWVGLVQVIEIWQTEYDSEPNILPFLTPTPTPTPTATPTPTPTEATLQTPHGVVRLPNGNTLITDGGSHQRQGDKETRRQGDLRSDGRSANHTSPGLPLSPSPCLRCSRIIEVDEAGEVVWSFDRGLVWAHDADRLANGNTLIADTSKDRIIEVNTAGEIVWSSDDISLSDGTHLRYPNDVDQLPGGRLLITDRDNQRIVEIDRAGNILWQLGVTGEAGDDSTHLNWPHNADRLPNGHTILADSGNDRIIEVDSDRTIVWEYRPAGTDRLRFPKDADRLPNGNILITDSHNARIVEVTSDGAVVWEYSTDLGKPYDADRLPNGNTLISGTADGHVIEVDPAGTIVWQYPPPTTPTPTAYEPPIDVTFNIHMDPVLDNYTKWRERKDNLLWLESFVDGYSGDYQPKLNIEAQGDHAEFYLNPTDPEAAEGREALADLYAAGHSFGTHAHNTLRSEEPDSWTYIQGTATAAEAVENWQDHIGYVEQLYAEITGNSDPEFLRQLNASAAMFLPIGGTETRLAFTGVYSDPVSGETVPHGFSVQTGGKNEHFYCLFDHDVQNPWRPGTQGALDEDLTNTAFVTVPQMPPLGKIGVHAHIPDCIQDNSVPSRQRMFIQEFLERLYREYTDAPDKVWTFGWHEHLFDIYPTGSSGPGKREFREEVEQMVDWLNERFVGQTTANGNLVARYATVTQVRDEFETWEQDNPGVSSFEYDRPTLHTTSHVIARRGAPKQSPPLEAIEGGRLLRFARNDKSETAENQYTADWDAYPYELKGLARELANAHYEAALLPPDSTLQVYRFEQCPSSLRDETQGYWVEETDATFGCYDDSSGGTPLATSSVYVAWRDAADPEPTDLTVYVGRWATAYDGVTGTFLAADDALNALPLDFRPVVILPGAAEPTPTGYLILAYNANYMRGSPVNVQQATASQFVPALNRLAVGLVDNTGASQDDPSTGSGRRAWFLGVLNRPTQASLGPTKLVEAALQDQGEDYLARARSTLTSVSGPMPLAALLIHDHDFFEHPPADQEKVWALYEQVLLLAQELGFQVVTMRDIYGMVQNGPAPTLTQDELLAAAESLAQTMEETAYPPEFVEGSAGTRRNSEELGGAPMSSPEFPQVPRSSRVGPFSLTETFEGLARALAVYRQMGSLPATVETNDLLGPTAYFTGSVAPTAVPADAVLEAAVAVSAAITDRIPSQVTAGSQAVNPAEFLYLMAQEYVALVQGGPAPVTLRPMSTLPLAVTQNQEADPLTKLQFWTYKPAVFVSDNLL